VPSTHVRRISWTPHLEHWEMGFGVEVGGAIEPGTRVHVRLLHCGARRTRR
jgi:hypothetical protein